MRSEDVASICLARITIVLSLPVTLPAYPPSVRSNWLRTPALKKSDADECDCISSIHHLEVYGVKPCGNNSSC